MNEEEILDKQDYEGDFWPGFVDILSGLILIFSFLVLVAGIVIAVIIQIFSTIPIPPEPFRFVLTTIQQSPLTIPSRFDVIEAIKQGNNPQTLVQQTRQESEVIGEQIFKLLNNYPDLKRKLVQEIRFLQEEIRLVTTSPPPEGQTQSPRDFEGGRSDARGADNLSPAEVNWESRVDGDDIFISFDRANSDPPSQALEEDLRSTLRNWINRNQNTQSVSLLVGNAIIPYTAIAQRDSLKRVLYVRSLLRRLNPNINVSIESVENNLVDHSFGWIRIRSE